MNDERHGLFRELDAPPGGPERLDRRLDELSRRGHTLRWRLAAAAVAAAALLAVLGLMIEVGLLGPAPERLAGVYDAPQFDRLLGRPPASAELTVRLNDQNATVAELESGNEKVRIYRIDRVD